MSWTNTCCGISRCFDDPIFMLLFRTALFVQKHVAVKRKKFGTSSQGKCRNCCWVCDSWQEVEFAYQLNEKDMKKFKKILLAGEKSVPAHKLAREKEKISRAL